MVVTGKEIEQLKPWIKSTVRSMFGIEDPSFVIAATNCLERQLSKGDTQKALESLMAANSAAFTDKLFDEVSSLKAKKKAPAKVVAASPPAPEVISPKRKRDETPEVAEKDSKKSRSEKEKDEKRHRDKHDRDHRDRDREKEKDRDKDRDRDRDRTRDKDRRDKDREKESDRDRDRKDKKRDERDDRDKEKERDRKERDREKERDRDRDREREREKERDRDRDRRDRDRERDREKEKEKTPASKVANISAIKADLAKKLEEKRKAVANNKPVQPPPLILDSQGREVDSAGKLITTNISTTNIKTIKANKKYDLLESAPAPDVTKSKFYDARMAVPKVGRQRRDWSFVEHGTYIKKGDKLRTKAAEQEMRQRIADAAGGEVKQEDTMDDDDEDINPNLIQLGVKEEPKIEDPIPSVEWWDESIMTIDEYPTDPALLENPVKILKHDLWQYIEHPPIQDNSGPPPVLPLMLTKKELQKLRRGRRLEVQKDKQERVLLGIDPPPPPKVRISNLMRVLTNEAVQDPTQIEMKVRSEMDQRQANHDARNEARKLSKEERWAKKKRKLLEDAAKEMHCALFKLKHLESQKIRSKLDHVAQDCLLSGSIVLAKDMVLVIVEGGIKSIRKYKKLMANRIRWNAEEEDEVNEEEGNKKENKCDLVWEGTIQRANFKHFVIETTVTDNMARRFLAEHNVPHFWDMAKNFKDPLEL